VYFNEEKIMAIKISYEIAIEGLDEYGSIEDIEFATIEKNSDFKGWVKSIDYPFAFAIIKWSHDWDDSDRDYNYLAKDGTFCEPLPKYIMKIIKPCINESLNNKNFRE
tara:strand:- start:930 stop:1253 length:324 start_codon:yes stop_codon:yes gene_type:complete